MSNNILVIVGPTASGKSDLAVRLALEWGGEIISADSRQVYKGLDIATGKITKGEMRDITHYCLDIADPRERFSVVDWKKEAEKAISIILAKGKLPIICGGTGFYISTLIDDLNFPEVEVSTEEQCALEKKPVEELFKELEILDPRRASDLKGNGGDKNKRRLSRAIMISRTLGQVPKIDSDHNPKSRIRPWEFKIVGLTIPDAQLRDRIHDRTIKRMKDGMIEEARKLHMNGLSLSRMREIGLEYKYLADYLENLIDEEQLVKSIDTKDWQYSRRQMTWWRNDKRVKWYTVDEARNIH